MSAKDKRKSTLKEKNLETIKPTVHPGDLRINKGSIYLKDAYIPLFR